MRTAPSAESVVATRIGDERPGTLAVFARCEALLPQRDVGPALIRGFVPGRIELLGKHVDYAGGRSIVCTVDRGVAFVAQPRDDAAVRVTDAMRGESREIMIGEQSSAMPGDWSVYVAAVVRRIARDCHGVRGVNLVFASDLPAASGLSSSTAVLITVFLALAQRSNWFDGCSLGTALRASPVALADYLAAVESGRAFGDFAGDAGVGTLGGSQDHAAILCSRPDAFRRFAFLPTVHLGDVALPEEFTLAVAFSGVRAAKTAAARESYNRAALAVAKIQAILRRGPGEGGQSLAQTIGELGVAQAERAIRAARTRDFTHDELLRRLRQFVIESEVHDGAVSAVIAGDWPVFAGHVARSQSAAEELLRNQVAETTALVRLALANGARAASAFGAGFGGSVWALVRASDAARFLADWHVGYCARFTRTAERAVFFSSRPCHAARYIA